MTAPVTAHTIGIAHLQLGDEAIDVLLTTWSDGTAEAAWRPGPNLTHLRWSPPVPVEVAP